MAVTDPYSQGGYVDVDGGNGSWDDSTDVVPVPSTPSISAVDTNMICAYTPTLQELQRFSDVMFSSDILDVLNKLFNGDPQRWVISLGILPNVIAESDKNGKGFVWAGNTNTGVTMNSLKVQFKKVSLGTLTVDEFFNSFLDYAPHTQVEIYLPFIGVKSLDTDMVMGKSLEVIYSIDLFTGLCVANIEVDGTALFSFSGNCMTFVPVTSESYSQAVQAHITMAAAIGSNVAKTISTGGEYLPTAMTNIITTALVNAPDAYKPYIQKTGSLSSAAGLLSPRKPFLIITRTRPAISEDQSHLKGYQSFVTDHLYNLSGYTEVENIHLKNIPATGDELDELLSILQGGFII